MATAAEIFRRVDAAEIAWCLKLNRGCIHPRVREFFAVVSRLGDGIFWYTIVLSLPLIYGEPAVLPAVRMAIAGFAGLAIYKFLKARLVRERPYISFEKIVLGTRALDRYSFPSGHTLHAVNFAILISLSYPELAVLCVPFAMLVAMSRVVLGLHYPSDVMAGAVLGAGLATASIVLIPVA